MALGYEAVQPLAKRPISSSGPAFALAFRMRYALQLGGAALLFWLSTLPVRNDYAPALEEQVFRLLNDLPGILFGPVWAFMQFGNFVAVPVVMALALALKRVRAVLGFALVGAGKWFGARIVKTLVVRHRPATFLADVAVRDPSGSGQAFVSGHAVIAVGLAVVASPYVPARWRPVLWALAAIVCLGRVYVGAHLPLDVVGGAALGWALGALAHVLLGPSPRLARGAPGSERRGRTR